MLTFIACVFMHVFVGLIAMDVFEALSPRYAEAMRRTDGDGKNPVQYAAERLCCAACWPMFAYLAIKAILDE